MRKLKLQVQISIDGYIAGPNNEMDWLVWDWDDELKNFVTDLTNPVDCIILGRKLAEGFIPHWASVAANSDDPQFTAGTKFTNTNKVVFTKTLEQLEGVNTTLAKGDLVEVVNQLKQENGQDIMAYGGAQFVSSLIQNKLIDDYYLFVNPTAIGNGMPIFINRTNLKLVDARAYACGIVVMHYQPVD